MKIIPKKTKQDWIILVTAFCLGMATLIVCAEATTRNLDLGIIMIVILFAILGTLATSFAVYALFFMGEECE